MQQTCIITLASRDDGGVAVEFKFDPEFDTRREVPTPVEEAAALCFEALARSGPMENFEAEGSPADAPNS